MGRLTRRFWFHFLSLVSIVAFMLMGFSPVLSVFWATVVAFLTSLLRPESAMLSYDLFRGRGPIVRQLLRSKLVQALEARVDRHAERRRDLRRRRASSSAW